jgi:hypothetical protein
MEGAIICPYRSHVQLIPATLDYSAVLTNAVLFPQHVAGISRRAN